MRRQLSQPSFVNGFARNRSESVRPDLWPDHAWVPALGCQGGVLYDLCGTDIVSLIGTWSWGSVDISTGVSGVQYAVLQNYFYGMSEVSTFARFMPTNTSYTGSIFSCVNVDGYVQNTISLGWSGDNSRLTFQTRDSSTGQTGSRNNDISTGYVFPLNVWSSVATTYSVSASAKIIYANGVSSASSTTSIDALTSDYGYTILGAQLYSGGTPFVGRLKEIYFYLNRALTPSQISDLSTNPLLPFRRRQIQKYWVPSTGGTTFNAAWARNSNVIIQPGVH